MSLLSLAPLLRLLAFLLALASCAAEAQATWAEGIVRLSWDHPASSLGQVVGAKNYAGPGTYDLWLTLSGQSTAVRCFEIELRVQSARLGCQPAPALSGAWRFDGVGCAAGRACFEWNSFAGSDPAAGTGWEFVSTISYNQANGIEQIFIAECDPDPLPMPDPVKTYTLARFHFDHTGTCAAEEDSALITLTTAGWVAVAPDGSNGPESYWLSDSPVTLTWNVSGSAPPPCNSSSTQSLAVRELDSVCCQDPNMSPCAVAVPARGVSWGQVKAAYR